MKTPPFVIYVVDDDDFTCDLLTHVFESEGYAVKSFRNPLDFIAQIDHLQDGCIILDVVMPGMDGPAIQEELRRRAVDLPIIFLSGHATISVAVRTIKAGAIDFMTKPFSRTLLLGKVREILDTGARAERRRLSSLTPREREIMRLAIEGLTSKEIARRLGISYKTVQIHRFNLMQKAGVSNLMELARLALLQK